MFEFQEELKEFTFLVNTLSLLPYLALYLSSGQSSSQIHLEWETMIQRMRMSLLPIVNTRNQVRRSGWNCIDRSVHRVGIWKERLFVRLLWKLMYFPRISVMLSG